MNKKLTAKILIATAAALAAYDIYVASTPEEGDTISEVLNGAARKRPVVAFGLGLIAGHLFWPLSRASAEGSAE
jgi:hypothetical protein